MPPVYTIEDGKTSASPVGTTTGMESTVGDEKDIAIAIVGEHGHAIDPAIEARVLRKIDWFLIPMMSIGYGLVYYDKVGLCPKFLYIIADLPGNPRLRRALRNDYRPPPRPSRH